MSVRECDREQDVLDALVSLRWPDRADDDLRAHVMGCATCADLVTVAGALLSDETAEPPRDLPPASIVWWRAQLRAREDATRAALRPITITQVAAVGCATVLFLALLAAVVPSFLTWVTATVARFVPAIPRPEVRATSELAFAVFSNRAVQLAAGMWLLLAPVAAYVAFSRD